MNEEPSSDNEILKKLLTLLKKEEKLSEVAENEIIASFDSRGEKAVQILKEEKLLKIQLNDKLAIWEVEGKSKNYIIINNTFCECTDFQIRVLSREEKTLCYHLLAKIIGEKLGFFNLREIDDEEYNKMLLSRIK
jgi:predicted nucleic acid-binding Zn finger protein